MAREKCRFCDKDILIPFSYAMKVALRVKKRTGVELRVYACPRNQGYHVTSHDLWKKEEK